MKNLLFIALGGAIGAVARYSLHLLVHGDQTVRFPWATLAVNVMGSFFIGMAYVMIVERAWVHPDWRGVLMVGFLGAFTTFSTFSLEAVALLETGQHSLAFLYMGVSVAACLGAVWVGMTILRLV